MSGSVFDVLRAAASGLEEAVTEAAFTNAEAVGVWVDDPDSPNVAVIAHGSRIVHIGLSDKMVSAPLRQVQDLVNTGIFVALAQARAGKTAPKAFE